MESTREKTFYSDGSFSKAAGKISVEQNINNKIRSYLFKNYYKKTYGQTKINFDTNFIQRIINEHCLIDDITERKLLVLYCHNENDAFGKKVCESWFQMQEIQIALSNPKIIVTGHNITNQSQRNDLKVYMSSLIDHEEILTMIESGKSTFYIFVPTEKKMTVCAFIDEDFSKDKLIAALNDSIIFHETFTDFNKYYKATFGETRINFNTTNYEEVVKHNCLIDDLSKHKILVIYCHNENDAFGKVVCEEWFKNDEIQNILSDSRVIVLGYNIPKDSRQVSDISIYLPIEKIMVHQAYIGVDEMTQDEMTQDDFVKQLIDIKNIFDNVLKITNDENVEKNKDGQPQTCEEFQQLIADQMEDKDFDIFSTNEHDYLKKKIGFAYFGPPASSQGYNEKQTKAIKKVFDLILTQSDKYANASGTVVISFIFACCVNFVENNNKTDIMKYQFNHVPIFILRKCKPLPSNEGQTGDFCRIVIDNNLRVYSSWKNFLNENKYPKGKLLCVPRNGEYKCDDDGNVQCIYYYTPAYGPGQTILRGLDKTSAIAGLGSGGLLLVAAIPAITIAPIAITGAVITGAGVGIYSIGRNIANLINRRTHEEDLSFTEAESRAAYIGIVASALGFAGAGANVVLTQLAKNGIQTGNVIKSNVAIKSVNVLSKVNITASGVAFSNSVYDVTKRYVVDGEKPSTLILVQLSATALFFGNSIYNYRCASKIVLEAQNSTIEQISKDMRSNRHRKMFSKLQKETARVNNGNKATANAKVISAIRNTNNVDETMAILTRNNKHFNKLGIKFSSDDGQISFNGKRIDIAKFAGSMNKDHISEVMSLPPGKLASSSFKSSIEMGFDLKSIANNFMDPSVVQFTRELLNIFTPYIQKNITCLMKKIWPTFSERARETGLTKYNVISSIVDYICKEARTRLKLGSFGNGCIRVSQLLVNFFFCKYTISETVVEGCSIFIEHGLISKIVKEEKIVLERMEIQKKLENKRPLVKCSLCGGCYNQEERDADYFP